MLRKTHGLGVDGINIRLNKTANTFKIYSLKSDALGRFQAYIQATMSGSNFLVMPLIAQTLLMSLCGMLILTQFLPLMIFPSINLEVGHSQ